MPELIASFFKKDQRNVAAIVFYATIILIFCQKASFLADRHFLYETMNDLITSDSSFTQAFTFLFAMTKNEAIRTFLLAGELLLLIRCLLRTPDLVSYASLLIFSNLTYRGSYYLQDGGSNLSHIIQLYGMFFVVGASGFFKSEKAREHAFRCMLVLVRFQIIFLYAEAVFSKSQGILWRSGDALFYILQNDYFSNPLAKQIIMAYPWLSKIGTYPVFVFQFLFPLLVWSKKLRRPILVAGIAFHLGIALAMNLWLFSASMIIFYLSFLTPEEAEDFKIKVSGWMARLSPKWKKIEG